MIVSYLCIVLGIMGSIFMVTFIGQDTRYTYTPPFTDHEMTMLFFLVVCVALAAAGILGVIFSVVKKRQEDTLQRIQNMGTEGVRKDVCPHCGLNLASGVKVCPRCGYKKEDS